MTVTHALWLMTYDLWPMYRWWWPLPYLCGRLGSTNLVALVYSISCNYFNIFQTVFTQTNKQKLVICPNTNQQALKSCHGWTCQQCTAIAKWQPFLSFHTSISQILLNKTLKQWLQSQLSPLYSISYSPKILNLDKIAMNIR